MLLMIPAEVDEGRVEVQGVAGHHIEEARILGEHPFEESLGGGLFPSPGRSNSTSKTSTRS